MNPSFQNWNPAEVTSWLEKKGQSKLSALAQEHEWDGMILFSLYSVRADPGAYRVDCTELAMIPAGPLQLKLKGLLTDLFEGGQ